MMAESQQAGASPSRSFSEINELPPLKEVYIPPPPPPAFDHSINQAHAPGGTMYEDDMPEKPKAQPQKPGRKAGKQYGRRYRRPLPDTVKSSRYRCRPAVRDAEVGWKSARPFLSSKPRFRNHGRSALSFVFLSGAVGVADDECRGDIHGKPRMPSAVPPRN